ncbi:hypothetical protein HJG60_010369 [Phyllostomus discolor]|uniref:Uncharacterized protein n=1 Tax=Phyllostomus discolor TaxID=89673 RepID=A0A834AZ99_9CHIR|nr:hypothetical protein HJG60_010369 [Phyllostomus discolor]
MPEEGGMATGAPDQPGRVWLCHSLKGRRPGRRQTGPLGQIGLSTQGVGHSLQGLPEQSPETQSFQSLLSQLFWFALILLSFVSSLLFYYRCPHFSPFALLHPFQAAPPHAAPPHSHRQSPHPLSTAVGLSFMFFD